VAIDNLTGITGLDTEEFEFVVAPNPGNGQFSVIISGPDQRLDFRVIDLLGNVVSTQSLDHTAGSVLRFDISGLPSGIYLLTGGNRNHKITKKIIVF
jgi:hypothetical protein